MSRTRVRKPNVVIGMVIWAASAAATFPRPTWTHLQLTASSARIPMSPIRPARPAVVVS
jgi:hypothetical protein